MALFVCWLEVFFLFFEKQILCFFGVSLFLFLFCCLWVLHHCAILRPVICKCANRVKEGVGKRIRDNLNA